MKTGVIKGADQMRVFAPLLLPHVREAIKRGEPVTALGLTDGQTAVGALAGHLQDEIFQIDSLYVAPSYRRQGGATLLFETLARLLEDWETGIYVRFVHTNEEQDSLHPFLEHMGFGDPMHKQEEKKSYEIKTEQVHQEQVHQEDGSQTQVNLQINAPQLVDTQIEENMQLVAQAQSTLEQTHATETAQGGPVLEQIPQNEKFFQRRKRRKLQTKLAKRLSGNATADYVGYNLQRGIQKKKEMVENSKNKLGIPANADQYLSKFFLKGCQLDKNGQPATPQDMQNLIDDRNVLEAFSSGDILARKPYLDHMISDVLKVKLTPDMLTSDYLERHGMEVFSQIQLLSDAEKVLFSDPVNKAYSCSLPGIVLMRIRNVLQVNRMLQMDKLAQGGSSYIHDRSR